MREDVSLVIQPVRKIPLHYIKPLDDHITELLQQDVIEGPLIKEEPGTWISNLVITDKAFDKGRPKTRGESVGIYVKQTNQLCPSMNSSDFLPACDSPPLRTSTRKNSFILNWRSKYNKITRYSTK